MPALISVSDSAPPSPTSTGEQDELTEEDLQQSLFELMRSADRIWLRRESSTDKGTELGKCFKDIRGISGHLLGRFLLQERVTGFAHYFGFLLDREPETLAGFVSAIDLASVDSFDLHDLPASTLNRLTARWFTALASLDERHLIESPSDIGGPAEDNALAYHSQVLRRLTERFPAQPSLGTTAEGKCLGGFVGAAG